MPFIKGKHISQGFVDLGNCDYISHSDHLKVIARSKPEKGDILFSNIGSVGDTAFINTSTEFSIKNVALLKPDLTKVNGKYLYYHVIGPTFQEGIIRRRSGSAQPFISLDMLRNFEITYLSEKSTQDKIAAILSAYDDLIENNTRRIQILEEMAQALYREWFVNFRFPGHEKSGMVESEVGLIPEGWEVVAFTEVAEVLSGGTPQTNNIDYWGGSIPFFTPKDVAASFYVFETERRITEIGLSKCSSKLYGFDIVFITARGTVGQVVMPAVPMAMSQSCYALKSRLGAYPLFLFMQTRACVDMLKQNAHGAVFDTIIVDTFRKLRVVRPKVENIRQFELSAKPFFDQMKNLLGKNRNLRQTRDLLLPKLISGEVDVAELDIMGMQKE